MSWFLDLADTGRERIKMRIAWKYYTIDSRTFQAENSVLFNIKDNQTRVITLSEA